jgi:hypothetical protein
VRLDVASALLQWATGGLLGLWVTQRHRMVGVGYGWLLRGVFGTLAVGAIAAGIVDADLPRTRSVVTTRCPRRASWSVPSSSGS